MNLEKPKCDSCSNVLGSFYYQDVPGQGDLCLVCHGVWMREKIKTKSRADCIRAIKPGEHLDFDIMSTTHYASIRGSAYGILGCGVFKFERLHSRKVRMFRL